jgi:putative transposase
MDAYRPQYFPSHGRNFFLSLQLATRPASGPSPPVTHSLYLTRAQLPGLAQQAARPCVPVPDYSERLGEASIFRFPAGAVGKPRGRGKIERFFQSLSQVFLSRLPGYARSQAGRAAVLTLPELAQELERYLIREYLVTPHRTTGEAPQARWDAGGFLPRMPESLEQLDLLLLTVPRTRRVHPDGIRFMGFRYIDPTLAAYIGEEVLLRYDPRDMAEIRVFYQDRFLCRAVCQELAGETVGFREIASARDRRRRELRQTVQNRRRAVDSLWEAKHWGGTREKPEDPRPDSPPPTVKLKRYFHE